MASFSSVCPCFFKINPYFCRKFPEGFAPNGASFMEKRLLALFLDTLELRNFYSQSGM
jgi:hypothetical protein